ncbi:hypothetical protein O3M35_011360 [Rhynocoris fuscipes]|uniref:Ig-like domain-containing protein n=1 Tax=Rhynocoris fuscipes TaxID=488301 RepID=A0AAW1CWC1_9HEMI
MLFCLHCVTDDRLPPGFPQITQSPTTKVVEIGHTAVLACAATGKPPPTIRWVKEMLPVQIGKNPRYTILDSSNMSGKFVLIFFQIYFMSFTNLIYLCPNLLYVYFRSLCRLWLVT